MNGHKDSRCNTPKQRVPWWMWVVIAVCVLPGASAPLLTTLSANANPTVRALIWLYPAYVVLSGLLAWQLYGRHTLMCWIVLILLLMSHACFYYLANATYTAY